MSEKKDFKIPKPWRIGRYYMYVAATAISLILPWIQVNGNHFFLLSFDKMKLHLAFVQFDMQELYLMPFLLMLLFLGIFGMTVVGGRVFCGWLCPQTIFRVVYRDLIETKILGLRKRIGNKQQDPDMSLTKNKVKKVVAILIWIALALIAAADFMWYFIPPEDFMSYLTMPMEHLTMLGFVAGVALFLVYDIVFLKENFCIYVCPYSRVQSVLYDDHTVMALYDFHRGGKIYDGDHNKNFSKQKELRAVAPESECTTCEKCVTVCPTHIDIRQGLQLECINCLECVDACTKVMGKLGKESLVQWSSTNEIVEGKKTKIWRSKTIMYAVALFLIIGGLVVMSGTKEYMLLNVNKTTQLYKVKEGNLVENNFILLFQNTEPKKHTYKIDIIGKYKDKIEIRRFKEITLNRGKMAKKVMVLATKERLVDDATKDTPITVMLKAYAVDEPERVFVLRKAVFIYPRSDKLK